MSGPSGRQPKKGSASPRCPTGPPPARTRPPCRQSATGSSHVASLTLQTTPDVDLGLASGAYTPSKTLLNAVTIQYAKELVGTNILINNACPGYVATDLNGFQGTSTPQEGAAIAIKLATLPDDGPTGGLFDAAGVVPW
ncbi:MAG TPA: hypothetical protein VGI96_08020 [Streptosporangiaceae bacterium]|jgi:NAD(P)-dependent dehydrogenase (short-subunit alcohol dehydrogenase family)